jgi:lysophospholipase L1-like esterase
MLQPHSTRWISIKCVARPSDPRGDCYHARQPARADVEYRHWLHQETRTLDLELWDLHDLLPHFAFQDSVHPTQTGHRAIAENLASRIEARQQSRHSQLGRTRATENPE